MRTNLGLLVEDKRLAAGVILFVVICLLSILQPVLTRLIIGNFATMAQGKFDIWLDPSTAHPLGTDRFGRDVVALLLLGIRFSLSIGLLAGLFSTFVGASIGLIAGFYGGWVDAILRSCTDVILVIPTLPLLITLSSYIKSMDVATMALLLSLFGWPFAARTIRAQVLSLRERGYVDLAQVSGLSKLEIVFQEIMPNLLPYIG